MTARIFNLQSGRQRLSSGASSTPPSTYGADTRADLATFCPSDSILVPTDPPFERGEIIQTLFDVGAVLFAFLFVSVTALAIVGSVGLLFFAL
jgi:hypothetical protein